MHSPVLVEASPALLGEVFRPDGLECARAARCVDVANDANDHQWRGFQHRDRLHNLPLVNLCNTACHCRVKSKASLLSIMNNYHYYEYNYYNYYYNYKDCDYYYYYCSCYYTHLMASFPGQPG